jgi:hypothetical protein
MEERQHHLNESSSARLRRSQKLEILWRVQRPVGHPEEEGDQGVGSLPVLPHRLPGREDWYQVLPPDRVSGAPFTEVGVANKSEPGQRWRVPAAPVSRRSQPGRSEIPRRKPGQAGGGRSQGQGAPPQRQADTWCFPAVSKDRELVWLRATRSQHVSATRITHQAAIRLGFAQSVTEAYQVRLRLSGEPRFLLRAEGVETLECVRSRSERRGAKALQPDVMPFAMSGWAIPGQTLPGATAPATRWHLRMNRRGGSLIYLNVELDPMRKRSVITHEAAV